MGAADSDPCDLQTVCEALRQRSNTAVVVTYSCVGDDDVRVLVSNPSSGPVVELLESGSASPNGEDRWYAVQIESDDRVVRRGPSRGCPQAELLRFVEDLLTRGGNVSADRYQRLG